MLQEKRRLPLSITYHLGTISMSILAHQKDNSNLLLKEVMLIQYLDSNTNSREEEDKIVTVKIFEINAFLFCFSAFASFYLLYASDAYIDATKTKLSLT